MERNMPTRVRLRYFSTVQKPKSSGGGQSQMALPAQIARSVGVLARKRLNHGQPLKLLWGQREYQVLWAWSFITWKGRRCSGESIR